MNPCQLLLLTTLATVQILSTNPARSAEDFSATVGQPCFITCDEVCEIKRGDRLGQAQTLYREDRSVRARVRGALRLGPENYPALEALRKLQALGTCPPATAAHAESCTIEHDPSTNGEGQYRVIIGGGLDQRALDVETSRDEAVRVANELVAAGQCQPDFN